MGGSRPGTREDLRLTFVLADHYPTFIESALAIYDPSHASRPGLCRMYGLIQASSLVRLRYAHLYSVLHARGSVKAPLTMTKRHVKSV